MANNALPDPPRSCCRCMSVRCATLLLGFLEVIGTIVVVGLFIFALAKPDDKINNDKNPVYQLAQNKIALGVGMGISLLFGLLALLMVAGVIKIRPWMVLPHVFLQIISIVVVLGLVGWVIYKMIEGDTENTPISLYMFCAACIFHVIIEGYMTWVVIKCYRWLEDCTMQSITITTG